MTFLPIVERELRVTARRRAVYWMRASFALVSIIIGACIFLGNLDEPTPRVGPRIFLGLSILALCYCLFAGRRLTVECLIEEKREGTLGLLFLTDLSGHDIVLGKLAATSLNGFFGLLALLPVLAVPVLMGGTSNSQFWRMALVLVVTFLFSLSVGIFASAAHRTLGKATATNLLLLLLFACGLPLMGLSTGFLMGPPFPFNPAMILWPLLYSSPIYAFVTALDANYLLQPFGFWSSVVVIHGLSWLLVLRAGRLVRHSWQDQVVVSKNPPSGAARGNLLVTDEMAKRLAYRRRLLQVNAFYWLAARNRRKPMLVWALLLLASIWWLAGWMVSGNYWFDPSVTISAAIIVNSAFKLWIVLEAGSRLAEDKKSGAIELLLASPLTIGDIIRGQWLALRRQFLAPILTVAVVQLLFLWPDPPFSADHDRWPLFCFLAAGLLMLAVDAIALSVVAIYQALAARSPAMAASNTVVRLLALPWVLVGMIFVGVGLWIVMFDVEGPGWRFYLGLWFAIGLLVDAFFGLAAWVKLRTQFRALAASRFSSTQTRPA